MMKLLTHRFGDSTTAVEFSDLQYLRHLLAVEAALAKVQGDLGVIPAEAAQRIGAVVPHASVNIEQLYAGMEQDGVPVSELVSQLRDLVGGDAASYVHWGATTQDIMDTALVLQIRACL